MSTLPPRHRVLALLFAALTALTALASLAVAADSPDGQGAAAPPLFRDAAPESGLDFVHWNGRTGELFFPEMTGAGSALFDADGDGDLDVYLSQGAHLGKGEPSEPYSGKKPPRDRLYRNDLRIGDDGLPTPHFVDITDSAGLNATGYGMGVATGDFDRDGDVDLFVTNFGPNQLWRNDGVDAQGQVRFTDVTAAAGMAGDAWSTSATFFDADGDQDLDLYVVNYVDFRLDNNITCYATSSRRDYCGPSAFGPVDDVLYRNLGSDADGKPRFENITRRAIAGYRPGRGLGVVAADLDGDHRVDLFVANDGEPNQLWRHGGPSTENGEPTFRDDALLAGVAVNRQGQPEASMGIAVADFDHDGDEDLFITHLAGETNTLYVNSAGGLFDDRTVEAGLAGPSLPLTGFGTGWIDVDRDGWLDLAVVNGAVRILEERARAGDDYPLDQADLVFHHRGDGTFENVTARAGAGVTEPAIGRGAAFGDLDNDGDTDILVSANHAAVRLLRNDAADAPWLGLHLRDGDGAHAVGATGVVKLRGGRLLRRRVHTDGSYASASDPRLLYGVGTSPVVEVTVVWADGVEETFPAPPLGAYTTLLRGTGREKAAD